MRKHSNFIALLLSVLMVASQFSVTTFAAAEAVADTQAAAVEQSADADQDQESSETESVTETPAAPEKVEVPEKEAAPKAEAEKAEAPKEEVPEEVAFDQSKTVDGVKVTVKADKGVFPADAKLSVKKVSVPKTVDTEDAVKAYAFDISILVGGKEVQPDGKAAVSFTTAEVKNYDTAVYHMDGKKAEELDVTEKGKTATVKTDSFSTYVVIFDTDGGLPVPEQQTVSDGDAPTRPADPEKSGEEFAGWYTSAGTQYDFIQHFSSDATLTAKWHKHEIELTPKTGSLSLFGCKNSDGLCSDKGTTYKITIKASDGVYEKGKKHEAYVEVQENPFKDIVSYSYDKNGDAIAYFASDGTRLNSAPEDAGVYTAQTRVRINGEARSIRKVQFTINKATPEWTQELVAFDDSKLITDETTPIQLIETPAKTSNTDEDGVVKYALIKSDGSASQPIVNWTTKPDEIKTAESGNYEIRYKVEETANFSGIEGTATIKVRGPKIVFFRSNGGEGTMPNQTVAEGIETEIDKNQFTREGYKFYGWSSDGTAKPGEAAVINEDEEGIYKATFNRNTTLFAIWQKYAEIENPPTPKELTYNGSEQDLINVGTSTEGSVKYSLISSSGEFEFGNAVGNHPVGKDVDTYTVWYKVVPTTLEFAESIPESIEVTINKKPVSVSGIEAEDKEYDGTTDAKLKDGTPTFDGLVEGDELSVEGVTGEFADAEAGENKVVNLNYDKAELVGSDAVNYELDKVNSQQTAKATITPKEAELITPPVAIEPTEYTGSDIPLIKSEGVASHGIVGYSLKSGGPYLKSIPTGNDVGEYEIYYSVIHDPGYTYTGSEGVVKAEIIPMTVDIKWFADENAAAPAGSGTVEYTYNGSNQGPVAKAYNGESVIDGVNVTVAHTPEKNAGDYEAEATGLTGSDNYALPSDGLKQAFKISPKPVGIKVLKANDKTYDGNTDATIDVGNAKIISDVSNDNVFVSELSSGATFEDKNVGTNKTVTFDPAAAVLDGAAKDNYVISAGLSQNTTTASITPMNVDVEWYDKQDGTKIDGTITYIYNAKNQVPFAKIRGVVEGDDVGFTVTGAQKNAGGPYEAKATQLTGVDRGNYHFTGSSVKEFKIEPKEITVVWSDAVDLTYNSKDKSPTVAAKTVAVDAGTDSDGCALEGDTVNVTFDTVAITSDAVRVPIDAGDYESTAKSVDNSNYVLKTGDPSLKHTFTIKQLVAELKWTPASDGTADGLVYNGKEQAPKAEVVNLQTDASGKKDECTVTVEGAKKDAGNGYTATAKALSNRNYKLPEKVTSKFSIAALPIEVKWSDHDGLVYNGSDQAPSATVDNLINPDKCKLTVVFKDADGKVVKELVDAGEYTAEVTATDNANYTVEGGKNLTTKITIDKAKVTVTANSATINYGDAFTPSGKVTPSDVSSKIGTIKYECSYRKNDKQGTYPITVKLENADPNYEVTLKGGTLTVKEKNTALVAKAATKGSKKAKISWTAVTGAAKYEIYFAKCNAGGKDHSLKKIKTVKAGKLSFTKKKLKKGQCYKFRIVAKDASGKVISKSLTSHFIAGKYNKKYTNAKSLKLTSAKSVTIYKGTAASVTAKPKKAKSKRKFLTEDHADLLRYTSSNKAVATVDENGTINGVGTGYCKVFVQTVNGIWQTVEVTVK